MATKPKKDKPAADKKKAGRPPKADKAAPEETGGHLDESQAAGEQGAVDRAFSTPAQERAGVPSDPAFDKDASAKEEPKPTVRMPTSVEFTEAVGADEFLPTFQKFVYVPYTDHEFAEQAKAMAAADIEIKEMEAEAASEAKEWKEKIKGVEARRIALSTNVTQGGAEKEITCQRRINEATQEMTLFDAESLRVIERRKLGPAEMQTEMGLLQTQRAAAGTGGKKPRSGKVVEGKFPADRVIGAGEPSNAKMDEKNDAAVRKLAEESAA